MPENPHDLTAVLHGARNWQLLEMSRKAIVEDGQIVRWEHHIHGTTTPEEEAAKTEFSVELDDLVPWQRDAIIKAITESRRNGCYMTMPETPASKAAHEWMQAKCDEAVRIKALTGMEPEFVIGPWATHNSTPLEELKAIHAKALELNSRPSAPRVEYVSKEEFERRMADGDKPDQPTESWRDKPPLL